MAIKAVIFDLWGTLIIDDPARMERRRDIRVIRVRRAIEAMASTVGTYDESRVHAAFAAADVELGRIHADGIDISAEARTVLHLRHLDPDIAGQLDEEGWRRMHAAILTPALERPPLAMPGAAEVLGAVRALGLRVGLISNAGLTPGFVLRQVLERMELLILFHDTVFSDEVEVAKPSAAIFERALEALDSTPGEAAFVGDQPVLDVLGPLNAGLWTIQYGDLRDDGIEPHARIRTLSELPDALRRLGLL